LLWLAVGWLLFEKVLVSNNLSMTPNQLAGKLISEAGTGRGTNFQAGLEQAKSLIETHWNNTR
jgi:hypothetical protein